MRGIICRYCRGGERALKLKPSELKLFPLYTVLQFKRHHDQTKVIKSDFPLELNFSCLRTVITLHDNRVNQKDILNLVYFNSLINSVFEFEVIHYRKSLFLEEQACHILGKET